MIKEMIQGLLAFMQKCEHDDGTFCGEVATHVHIKPVKGPYYTTHWRCKNHATNEYREDPSAHAVYAAQEYLKS